jgi:SAM-dependent methyltransferase
MSKDSAPMAKGLTKKQLQEIQDKVLPGVQSHVDTWLKGVTRDDTRKAASTHLAFEHVKEKVDVIERYLPGFITPKSRILEVGTGFGAFIIYGRAFFSWNITGCEPDPVTIACSLNLAKVVGIHKPPIVNGIGETLAFPDHSFDLVYSSNVLEHVTDPEKVLAEALRILCPGGYLFFTFPNYGSWWEGHYGIPWIPHMPKWIAKLYIRLYQRDPKYLDDLHLLTVPGIKHLLKPWRNQITVKTFGKDLWQERLETLAFGEWGSASKLKRMLKVIHRLPLLIKSAIFLGNLLHWYYPIILVLRKDE